MANTEPALGRHPWAAASLRVYANRSLPGTSALQLSLAELSVDDLRTAYDWSRPQEEALYELERHFNTTGLAWLADFARIDDLPGFRDVEISSRVALNTLQVVQRRARRIVELRCIAADAGVSVGGRIVADLQAGRVVLVDVAASGSTEEVLVASFLARRVLETWQTAYLEDPDRHGRMPVVSLALEEAQRVLSAGKDRDSNVFRGWPGRAGSSGWGLRHHPATEAARDELLSQFDTFFILGLADEKDRIFLRTAAKQDISARARRSDPDAGRVPHRQPGRPVRPAGHDRSASPTWCGSRRPLRPLARRRRPTWPPWWTDAGC